jgi:RinA family phage transcriptional activator
LTQRSISRGARKHIESELYAYHDTKQAIKDLRADIIEGSPVSDGTGIRGSEPGNTTLHKAARLYDDKLLRQLCRTVEAIDKTVARLPEAKRELVRLKYWDRNLTSYGIASKLGVDERTVWRWTNDINNAVAIELGWR